MSSANVIAPAELLAHWQGLRRVTRRVIEAFPEDQLSTFAVGGMRPFMALAAEMLGIAVPMVREIVGGEAQPFSDVVPSTKAELLAQWDASTKELDELFAKIAPERFGETVTVFGQYTNPVWGQIFYAIDNENHHRGQGYVYLRALGVEPPAFWDRS